jgi:hypothetical protein
MSAPDPTRARWQIAFAAWPFVTAWRDIKIVTCRFTRTCVGWTLTDGALKPRLWGQLQQLLRDGSLMKQRAWYHMLLSVAPTGLTVIGLLAAGTESAQAPAPATFLI